ncbi:MAG: DNA polymerase III subunit beta [Oligoflexales bacterium]
MKIKLEKSELTLSSMRSHGVILEKTLGYFSLKADGNELHLIIADRVLIIHNVVRCEIITPGEAFVPARFFLDVIKELPDGLVKLEKAGPNLVVTAGAKDEFVIKIPLIEGKQWRPVPRVASENGTVVPASVMSYMISQTHFCIAHEAARNYGSVGYLHKLSDNKLRLVGTDGYRLSYAEAQIETPNTFLSQGICLSKRALLELQKMCNEGFETLNISISPDNTVLQASVPDYSIFVRLSSIKYPNYQGVLPKNNSATVELSRPNFQNATKRVLLASDKTNAVQLCFSEHLLTLASKASGGSEGKEDIFLQDFSGEKKTISVNGKFLVDVFSTVQSDVVNVGMNGEIDPIVIIPKSEPKNCHSLHVLVPIREA